MASINDIKKEIKKNKKKIDDEIIEKVIKTEIKDVKDDILNADAGLDNPQSNFIQKLLFIVTGALNVLVGFTFYYLYRNNKSKKWIADCFLIGTLVGVVFAIITGLGDFLEYLRELVTKK